MNWKLMWWLVAGSSAVLLAACDQTVQTVDKNSADSVWEAPVEAQQQINPLRYDVDSVSAGQNLFVQHCQRCHGYYGEGNGVVGATLDQKPANLLRLSGKQEAGAFAWKIRQGRGEMPAYRDVLSETEVWQIVNFVASLENEEGSLDNSMLPQEN